MDLSSSKCKILNCLNSFRCILESLPVQAWIETYCENKLRKPAAEPSNNGILWLEATVGIILQLELYETVKIFANLIGEVSMT